MTSLSKSLQQLTVWLCRSSRSKEIELFVQVPNAAAMCGGDLRADLLMEGALETPIDQRRGQVGDDYRVFHMKNSQFGNDYHVFHMKNSQVGDDYRVFHMKMVTLIHIITIIIIIYSLYIHCHRDEAL